MKLNERYEIRIVVVEIHADGLTGEVYDDYFLFRKNKPNSSYRFGYVVFDTEYGFVPDNCNDWNESVEDAIADYKYNCL